MAYEHKFNFTIQSTNKYWNIPEFFSCTIILKNSCFFFFLQHLYLLAQRFNRQRRDGAKKCVVHAFNDITHRNTIIIQGVS